MTLFNMMLEQSGLKKQKSDISRRAWNILRLALLWARKGGVLKNKIIMDLRRLGHSQRGRGALYYGERELSFDDTPIIHIKMHRPASLRFKMPNLPCIKPSVDFDYDFDFHDKNNEEMYYDDVARKSFLKSTADDDDDEEDDEQSACEFCEQVNDAAPYDDEIDLKAEKFIAKFYEQMKLQRQISYLRYNEMPNTSVS